MYKKKEHKSGNNKYYLTAQKNSDRQFDFVYPSFFIVMTIT